MNIIIQAGGKGTRLGTLTANKPKCLVPVNNRPIIFHIFNKFPDTEFIIIGDYKFDVLKNYLETFAASVNYKLIKANGSGNICGISEALNYINDNEQLMLIWSDLILSKEFEANNLDKDKSYIGLSGDFECSWSFINGKLDKTSSKKHGVAGCYIFSNKKLLHNLPESGSFTTWLKESGVELTPLPMRHSKEIGTPEALNSITSVQNRCRPYNKLEFKNDKVIKTGLTEEGRKLIEREIIWYKQMNMYGFDFIPKIYSLDPLTMEKINGTNIFQANLSKTEKINAINNLIKSVNQMHSYDTLSAHKDDLTEEYYTKTINRLESIKKAVPFSQSETIIINGKNCKNILFNKELLKKLVENNLLNTIYCPIHGDCTLTNTMIDTAGKIYFIDARGYFGKQKVFGDIRYDWAKLYYSVEGCFDQFNIKNFDLKITEKEVEYKIQDKGWRELTEYFISKLPECSIDEIKQIHAIIWLSLANHAWEDFDSMCLAFYNGTYLLNEYLGEDNEVKRTTIETVNA